MSKGKNTFELYQEERQLAREVLIRNFLRRLKESRVRFKYVTDLAYMVAKYIAEQESRNCDKSTILRNKRYKSLLLSFFANQQGGGAKKYKTGELTVEEALSLMMTAQLDLSNLKREVVRLNSYVTSLEKELAGNTNVIKCQLNDQTEFNFKEQFNEVHMMYIRTCQALHAVLRNMENLISIDPEKERFLDLSRIINNVLVEAPITTPFFKWLIANKNIG